MGFSDKLVYMMNLYKVNNAKLARGINVDPSLISRWKSGIRIPPYNSTYIMDIARYFLILTTSSYKIEILKELLKTELSQDETDSVPRLTQALSDWFLSHSSSVKETAVPIPSSDDSAINIIKNISNIIASTVNINSSDVDRCSQATNFHFYSGQPRKYEIFKGREGKRRAVLNFLNMVLASSKPLELLLTSNEDTRWMTEDKEFLQSWAKTLRAVIDLGHSITIIHVVNRDTSEIMSILNYWMPLHLTGRLRSYYHPKYIENKLKPTYFLIRGIASVVSFYSNGFENTDATFFFKETFETSIFEANFQAYLSECKPLLHIYSENNILDYYKQNLLLEEKTGVYYKIDNHLSGLFMPQMLIEKLIIHPKCLENNMQLLHKNIEAFHMNLSRFSYIFVIPIELLDKIVFNRKYIFSRLSLFNNEDIKIENTDLVFYFENMVRYLLKYDNLEIYLSSSSGELNLNKVSISYKENYSSSFTSYLPDGNPIAVVLNESNILNSLDLYFEDYFHNIPSSNKKKDMVIEKLRKVINCLKTIN